MVHQWDDTTKRLIQSNPQHFVSWIVEGGIFKTYLATELRNWTLTADMMMQVLDRNMLLHLDIQSKEDSTMPQRLLEYNILATREHQQLVLSCVLYLRMDRGMAQPPLRWHLPSGQETLSFHFAVIRLWEIPSRQIVETGLSGLLPLLPLTREGQQRETINLTIERLIASNLNCSLPSGKRLKRSLIRRCCKTCFLRLWTQRPLGKLSKPLILPVQLMTNHSFYRPVKEAIVVGAMFKPAWHDCLLESVLRE